MLGGSLGTATLLLYATTVSTIASIKAQHVLLMLFLIGYHAVATNNTWGRTVVAMTISISTAVIFGALAIRKVRLACFNFLVCVWKMICEP